MLLAVAALDSPLGEADVAEAVTSPPISGVDVLDAGEAKHTDGTTATVLWQAVRVEAFVAVLIVALYVRDCRPVALCKQ